MASHLSTIRPSYMENFGVVERRRCSIVTAADGEKKGGNRFPSDDGDDGGGRDTDQEIEEEWLSVLQIIKDENEARRCYRSPLGGEASLCMHRSY